jgi:hypothetical protein
MGRRWGKTYMGGVYALTAADHGGAVAWVVPTYKNARAPWRFAENLIAPIVGRLRVNRTERVMEFPSGGRLAVYSADNDVALRGEAFDVVIVDEAAMVKEETYTDVLLPTLADRDGRIMLISTPKGRNWFYTEWLRGQGASNYLTSYQAPSSDNPNPRIKRAAAAARERVGENTYRQEWLAEFVEDELTIFAIADIDQAQAGAPELRAGEHRRRYITAVDVGRRRDATVINTFDVTRAPYTRVSFERMYGAPYPLIQQAIEHRAQEYPGAVYVESNGVGDPVIENLTMPVTPFLTTQRSKVQALQALQLLFERGDIKARWDARERAALISASWDDDHTADEVMSLAIAATHMVDAPVVVTRARERKHNMWKDM